MKKYMFFLYLLTKKTEFIPCSKTKCPKSGFMLLYWSGVAYTRGGGYVFLTRSGEREWGEHFFRVLSKCFTGKECIAPPRKNWPVRLWTVDRCTWC